APPLTGTTFARCRCLWGMGLPEAGAGPPVVLLGLFTPVARTTPWALPRLVPVELVPMKLPATSLPVAVAPEIETPAEVLNPMTLAPAATVPPMVLPGPLTTTPTRLALDSRPVLSVPIRLAWTRPPEPA